jgi:hypothetical protein
MMILEKNTNFAIIIKIIIKRYIMLHRSLIALSLISSITFANDQMIQKGNMVSASLLQKLGGELKAQMQAGGAEKALHFCSQNALSLTQEVGQQNGVALKRVSLGNRNPINQPTNEEKIVLEKWETMVKNHEPLPAGLLQKFSDGKALYYKPIVINNEACLKCHGTLDNTSPLAQSICTLYPQDKAMGYKMGDLRGMIVVDVTPKL